MNGTSYDIRLDTDGLLMHGPQLTWMDACVENQPVTPRTGKAVEIQALWFNALKIMQTFAGEFNENEKETGYAQMAEKTSENFIEKFWDSENGYLFDTIGTNKDNSLRPNQIIAVSLDFTMLDEEKNEKIVDVVHKKLLTPYGVRTLSRSDPLYKNHYFGDRRTRDHAYHNGTIWPWLLGPFTKAYLKAKGYTEFRREYALKNFLFPLMQSQIKNYGLGTINEIFDGDPPHQPRGCIAQAWSIAEPFRAYVEDIHGSGGPGTGVADSSGQRGLCVFREELGGVGRFMVDGGDGDHGGVWRHFSSHCGWTNCGHRHHDIGDWAFRRFHRLSGRRIYRA